LAPCSFFRRGPAQLVLPFVDVTEVVQQAEQSLLDAGRIAAMHTRAVHGTGQEVK
jgi:hypothetical protein